MTAPKSASVPNHHHHPPRVLLTGLGADELLGGYGRHGQAWRRGGAEALQQELLYDQERLWDRNLGRDDRILSDHSVEVRLPFLDPHVVHFCRHQLCVEHMVDFDPRPPTTTNTSSASDRHPPLASALVALPGDKRVLRLVAQRLGLPTAATAVKRAIQFGTRVAQVSDKRRFGSRSRATGTATVVADAG